MLKYKTGSRVICDPAPEDTDEDWVIYPENYQHYVDDLLSDGWETYNNVNYVGELFTSLRKGDLNYIVVSTGEMYNKFVLATKVAKRLNLLKKEERILLFQAILYNKYEDD